MGSQQADPDKTILPLLPLRDVVVYPHMVVPLFVGRDKSIVALEHAMESDKQIVLVAQKNPAEDNPGTEDVYQVGTFATILQMLKLPDGTLKSPGRRHRSRRPGRAARGRAISADLRQRHGQW